jgi:hypothetical protein
MRIALAYDPDEDEDEWVLLEPYARETLIGWVEVPAGFHTDLGSVPRQVWKRFPKFGRWTGATIIHDWLYRRRPRGGLRRSAVDDVFEELLRADGVRYGDVALIMGAVRQFGDRAWNA